MDPDFYAEIVRKARAILAGFDNVAARPATTHSLVHAAYVKLHRSAAGGELADSGSLGLWATTMRNLLIGAYRKQQVRRSEPDFAHLDALASADPQNDALDLVRVTESLHAVAQSDPRGAGILYHRQCEGLRWDELARMFGLNVDRARYAHRKAAAALAVELRQRGLAELVC